MRRKHCSVSQWMCAWVHGGVVLRPQTQITKDLFPRFKQQIRKDWTQQGRECSKSRICLLTINNSVSLSLSQPLSQKSIPSLLGR